MTEPLTREHFDDWRSEEFVPHTVQEELYEKKVDRLWWTAVTALGMGGAVLSIFMWVLLQKNTQIEALQIETSRIAQNQAGVLKTLEAHTAELQRQAARDTVWTQTLMDIIKQQAVLHERSGNSQRR